MNPLDKIQYLAIRLAQTETPRQKVLPQNLIGTESQGTEGVVSHVLTWVFIVVGGAVLLMLIIGGFMYITAAGQEAQIERAKKTIRAAIIGFIIILLAAIVLTVITFAVFRNTGVTSTNTGNEPVNNSTPAHNCPENQFWNPVTGSCMTRDQYADYCQGPGCPAGQHATRMDCNESSEGNYCVCICEPTQN